jgi:hypothetical protein
MESIGPLRATDLRELGRKSSGSKPDLSASSRNVGCTPMKGRRQTALVCPFCAAVKTGSIDASTSSLLYPHEQTSSAKGGK